MGSGKASVAGGCQAKAKVPGHKCLLQPTAWSVGFLPLRHGLQIPRLPPRCQRSRARTIREQLLVSVQTEVDGNRHSAEGVLVCLGGREPHFPPPTRRLLINAESPALCEAHTVLGTGFFVFF